MVASHPRALLAVPGPVISATVTDRAKIRIVVGLSGGVDSSAAAALLVEQGYDVIGITLKLWPQDCISRAEDKCCGPQAVMDARSVSHKLGIPYYLIDEADDFQQQVIHYFAAEYKAGRTPNPCVMCNEKLKFGTLINRARQLGAEYVATGHFARVEPSADGRRHLLKRGRDPRKDQSYFLFSLQQEQLARSLFPLGGLTKHDTREIARENRLKTADKEESMEICFVPDNDYGRFLQQAKLAQAHGKYTPLVVKIAPDLTQADLRRIARSLVTHKIDGVIATNTTTDHSAVAGSPHAEEAGGLSGRPLRAKSTAVIRTLAKELAGALPIIGVGGIMSGSDAREKVAAGAALVQIYTGLIYKGPDLVAEIAAELATGA